MAKRNGNTPENTPELPENVSGRMGFYGDLIPVPRADADSALANMNDDTLRGIGSSGDAFADALALAEAAFGSVETVTEIMGNGFALLPKDDKGKLVGNKLLFLKWGFNDGDFGLFCSVAVVTADGQKYIVNDGSSGICGQLHQYTIKSGRFGGLVAPRGLRESTYSTCVSCGKPRSQFDETCSNVLDNGSACGNTDTKRGTGTTYYIDLSV